MAQIVGSAEYMTTAYVDHQKKYRKDMRESDKVTLSLIEHSLPDRSGKTLLDIGCHNGNLLHHIKTALPELSLRGADIFPEVIDQCRADSDLVGIDFSIMDVLDLSCEPVDVIVVSAVLFRFDEHQHGRIWHNLFESLRPGGVVVSFDLYNPFRQTLRIDEVTDTHPEGLVLTFRAQRDMAALLEETGFAEHHFQMFDIPIDLPLADPGDPLYTHTRALANGTRLQFRGGLYQPWCHLVARKADK